MTNRRDFLKKTALFGALTAVPATKFAAGSEPPAADDTSEHLAEIESYNIRARYIRRMEVPPPPRVITIPDVEGFKVLKGDFHMHTLFSDGLVMPTDRVNEAVDNGLDVIAITEHIERQRYIGGTGRLKLAEDNDNHNKSYDYAKPLADEKNILLVRGAEVTKKMPPGHYNTLFVEDINPIGAVKKDWRKMLRAAADQGAFILWNHPGWERPGAGLEYNDPVRFLPEHVEIWENGWMHGIEVYNGDIFPIVSDWCNERDLALFANSDAHPSEWILYGHQNPQRPVTLVLARERTLESVKEALFAKRTVACAAGMVWGRDPWLPALLKACVDIEFIAPGRLELTNKSSLPCTVRAGGLIRELPKDSPRQIDRTKGITMLTVENWLIGTDKPLQVPLDAWNAGEPSQAEPARQSQVIQ